MVLAWRGPMKFNWQPGNRVSLLVNGEGFYPRVFDAIAKARRTVLIETFILFEDKVGMALHKALCEAARRGVVVHLTVDGWGSYELSEAYLGALVEAGVHVHIFDQQPRILPWRFKVFRRLHRKIVAIDARIAFVGGINYGIDHLAEFGAQAKIDYAVELEGPVVEDIHCFVEATVSPTWHWLRLWQQQRRRARQPRSGRAAGSATVLFVTRDNREHFYDIESHYRAAIRSARREVMIANAYFFPGYRLLRDLRAAARRGVRVTLILQGKQADMAIVPIANRLLYRFLLPPGVRIYEYCERPLHGKVALADDEWATVGSSNLDPTSLALNLEANVFIRDRAFNQALREELTQRLSHCHAVDPAAIPPRSFWQTAVSLFVLRLLRRFSAWARWLPRHRPRLHSMLPRPPAVPARERRSGT